MTSALFHLTKHLWFNPWIVFFYQFFKNLLYFQSFVLVWTFSNHPGGLSLYCADAAGEPQLFPLKQQFNPEHAQPWSLMVIQDPRTKTKNLEFTRKKKKRQSVQTSTRGFSHFLFNLILHCKIFLCVYCITAGTRTCNHGPVRAPHVALTGCARCVMGRKRPMVEEGSDLTAHHDDLARHVSKGLKSMTAC